MRATTTKAAGGLTDSLTSVTDPAAIRRWNEVHQQCPCIDLEVAVIFDLSQKTMDIVIGTNW